jgi:hypothetical protein
MSANIPMSIKDINIEAKKALKKPANKNPVN